MISRLASALKRQSAYRRTRNELGRLSDRDLQDLGIGRSEINSVARAGVIGL